MTRFRQDNTDGYSDADLAALNEAFDEIVSANYDYRHDANCKSWQDSVAEKLLARYDNGVRGDALTR